VKIASLSVAIIMMIGCLALSACSTNENANTMGNMNTTKNANTSATNTNTTSNVNAAETPASLADYNLPYEATKDTDWISNPNSPNPTTGSLKEGDKIFFNREPSSIGATWQDAKIPDGTRKFVHPSDFKKL
jgi:guanyl-specific ribonuclease Sa